MPDEIEEMVKEVADAKARMGGREALRPCAICGWRRKCPRGEDGCVVREGGGSRFFGDGFVLVGVLWGFLVGSEVCGHMGLRVQVLS